MSTNTSNKQTKTLEDRLKRRQRLHAKLYSDKTSTDESDITSIKYSPRASQSLDSTLSRHTNHISSSAASTKLDDQRRSSLTTINSLEVSSTHNHHSKQNQKDIPSEPSPSKHQQHNYSHQDEKAMIIKETISSTPIQQKAFENSYSNQNEEPIIREDILTPKLSPPAVSPRLTRKHNLIQKQETIEKSHAYYNEEPVINKEPLSSNILPPIVTPRRTRKFNSSSYPEYTTALEKQYYHFIPSYPKPKERLASEPTALLNKHRYASIHPRVAKQNSLPYSYVFSKRIIDAELARIASSRHRTVWD
ncbi:unnamed protein product [Adineta steineri]|uniref:Uncharacterized protein n=1 Tax=Adineta steineri TaxID=433720 RepID=A0A814JGR5_9BILA|nr:unnamed protein product [Adineta steineri]CAF1036707.1 unnamed protein product [Adineta steineri]CAF3635139.1 unnamed protein product [Adineta steineri]CAF3812895.1 unnamed protein product [Adineta steineri]